MPIFEYMCSSCGKEFETLVREFSPRPSVRGELLIRPVPEFEKSRVGGEAMHIDRVRRAGRAARRISPTKYRHCRPGGLMQLPRFVAWMFPVGIMLLGAGVVSGQNYPNRPVRIVTGGVGSGGDFVSRVIAQGLSDSLGQQVIVDNRPSGVIPGDTVAKASPDGYVLLVSGSVLWIGPLLRDTPYDPVKDFAAIAMVTSSPNILVVHPSLPVKSVRDLIALAKARPGALNYSSAGTGASTHLAAELFKAMAGVNIVRIPYKSSAAEMADLIGGQVQLTFGSTGGVTSHVKSGRLRAVAVTSPRPSALAPGLPTVAASGVPGYESVNIAGMFAPAGTPRTIISRLNQETARVLNQADVKEKLFNSGVETVGGSPEECAAAMKSEMARLGKVIKDAGIRAE